MNSVSIAFDPYKIPAKATHPGSIIADEIEFYGVSVNEFAQKAGIEPNQLQNLAEQRIPLSPEIAFALEKTYDLPAAMLLRMQTQFEYESARIRMRDALQKADIPEAKKAEWLVAVA